MRQRRYNDLHEFVRHDLHGNVIYSSNVQDVRSSIAQFLVLVFGDGNLQLCVGLLWQCSVKRVRRAVCDVGAATDKFCHHVETNSFSANATTHTSTTDAAYGGAHTSTTAATNGSAS